MLVHKVNNKYFFSKTERQWSARFGACLQVISNLVKKKKDIDALKNKLKI
jgi:hypothetical protein